MKIIETPVEQKVDGSSVFTGFSFCHLDALPI